MHWFAWDRLCVPKKEGGMGFRDIESFNLALLGKQAWQIFENPNSLLTRVLKRKYLVESNILTATDKKKSSYVWKSILQDRDLLRIGLRFNVGDGKMNSAWIDPWLHTTPPCPPRPQNNVEHCFVSSLIKSDLSGWDEEAIIQSSS